MTAALMRRLLLSLLLALAPLSAVAANCELALLKATIIIDLGRAAAQTQNFYDAQTIAADARIPAIDGAQQSKRCGCAEAIPFFTAAMVAAERVNLTQFMDAMKQYGDTIRENGEKALAALRACASR